MCIVWPSLVLTFIHSSTKSSVDVDHNNNNIGASPGVTRSNHRGAASVGSETASAWDVPRHRAAHDCAPDRRPALRYLLLHDAAAPADLRCSREQPRRSRSRELGRAGGGHTFNMTIAHAGRNASTASADTDSGPTTLGGDYKMLKQLAGQITAATLP